MICVIVILWKEENKIIYVSTWIMGFMIKGFYFS